MAILLEIIAALAAFAPNIPEVVKLVETAAAIVQSGTVTPEMEAEVRTQLDAVRDAVNAA